VLYVANIFWATAYDTWYAMVDRDDDLRMGAKSTAILFGDMDLSPRACCTPACSRRWRWSVAMPDWACITGAGSGLPCCWSRTSSDRPRPRARACFRAFLHNHWVGMAIFVGIAVDFAMRGTAVAA
jgi:4-hydroxybenzoate polyprenyltransferase